MRYVEVADNTPKEVTAAAVALGAGSGDLSSNTWHLRRACEPARRLAVGPEDGKTAIKIVLLAEKSLRTHRIMNWNDLPA